MWFDNDQAGIIEPQRTVRSQRENKLIWLDNDTRCTIDLKSFKVNFFKYEIDLDAKNK